MYVSILVNVSAFLTVTLICLFPETGLRIGPIFSFDTVTSLVLEIDIFPSFTEHKRTIVVDEIS